MNSKSKSRASLVLSFLVLGLMSHTTVTAAVQCSVANTQTPERYACIDQQLADELADGRLITGVAWGVQNGGFAKIVTSTIPNVDPRVARDAKCEKFAPLPEYDSFENLVGARRYTRSTSVQGSYCRGGACTPFSQVSSSSVISCKSEEGNIELADTCTIEFDLCSEGFPQTLATAFWPGHPITNVNLDYRTLGTSSWLPIYDGNPSCAAFNTPGNPSAVRAIISDALGQLTSCTVNVGHDICGDDDISFF